MENQPKDSNKKAAPKMTPKSFRQKNWRMMRPFVLIITLIVLFSGFFISPFGHINKVNVLGDQFVPASEVKRGLPIKAGDSMLRIWGHKNKLATQIKNSNQRMKTVAVSTSNFNDVNVYVKEYPVIGYLQVGQGYKPILKSGVITDTTILNPQSGFPILMNFKDGSLLRLTTSQYKNINPSVRASIISITFSPTSSNSQRIILKMVDKNIVYATISTFGDKMNYYPSIASNLKVKSGVDLEVGAYSYPLSQNSSSNVNGQGASISNKTTYQKYQHKSGSNAKKSSTQTSR